jgi:hypothetical protein
VDDIPFVDEHTVDVAAPAQRTWDALLAVVTDTFEPFELDPLEPDRTRVRARTHAAFPGLGRLYRQLVIGTRIHVLATRGLLRATRKRAVRTTGPPGVRSR